MVLQSHICMKRYRPFNVYVSSRGDGNNIREKGRTNVGGRIHACKTNTEVRKECKVFFF